MERIENALVRVVAYGVLVPLAFLFWALIVCFLLLPLWLGHEAVCAYYWAWNVLHKRNEGGRIGE